MWSVFVSWFDVEGLVKGYRASIYIGLESFFFMLNAVRMIRLLVMLMTLWEKKGVVVEEVGRWRAFM